jgi:gas vesicle protein
MSSYSERDTYSQAGDWLLGTVRRNPEALLLMAAGCCLMMRSSSSRMSAHRAHQREKWNYPTGRASSEARGGPASAREGYLRATETASDSARSAGDYASQVKDSIADTASDYASQIKDRISDTANSYADSVTDFADDARRRVAEGSARLKQQTQATLQSSMQRVLREQPLAVAVAGLAAGAAVAALFPSTEVEGRAFGSAYEKLKDLADEAGERTMAAAGKAGERLKSAAQERGLTSEGLKEVAGEVADTFKDAMSGCSEERSGASSGGPAASGSNQSLGMEHSKPGGGHASNPAGSSGGGRSMR